MKKAMSANRQGFTLIELLVVVAIIGLLTGMVIISITHVKAKARDSQRVTDINAISTALTLYQNEYSVYPTYTGIINGTDDTVSIAIEAADLISDTPIDPFHRDSGDCDSLSGYYYYYESIDGTYYILWYCLETDSMSGKGEGENYVIP